MDSARRKGEERSQEGTEDTKGGKKKGVSVKQVTLAAFFSRLAQIADHPRVPLARVRALEKKKTRTTCIHIRALRNARAYASPCALFLFHREKLR